jgi:TonB family protein
MIGRVLALAASIAATNAPLAEPRQPTARWVVNFADAQCVATRSYGSKEEPVFLVLKQPPLGSVMQLAIIDSRGAGKPEQMDVTLTFDDQKPIKMGLLRYQPLKTKYRSNLLNILLKDFASAASARIVRIRGDRLNEAFSLSAMPALLKTMNECALDLRQVWNIHDPDKEEDRALDGGAKGNFRSLFRAEDYPIDAIYEMQSGTVRVALLINEKGRIADCAILETSAAPVLDAQSCAVIKDRARFKPAVGPDGKPVKDGYIQRITWRLE